MVDNDRSQPTMNEQENQTRADGQQRARQTSHTRAWADARTHLVIIMQRYLQGAMFGEVRSSRNLLCGATLND